MNDLADRLWSRVAKHPGNGCWEWQASLDNRGYGRIWCGRKLLRAHRVSYELTFGAIPNDLFVCHHCDNPKCLRPDHLFLGTCADNMRDAQSKGRIPIARPRVPSGRTKTHCKRGHAITGPGRCIPCARLRDMLRRPPKERVSRKRDICMRGHPLVEGNLTFQGGVRRCLICARARERARQERAKAARAGT